MNAGAWSYIEPRMRTGLKNNNIKYAGRQPSASPATGLKKQHAKEEKELLGTAFFGQPKPVTQMKNGVPIF